MKKRALIALVMTSVLVLSLVLASVAGASPTYVVLDSVNIGDTASEAGHNLVGWSNAWIKPGWGGGYGGGSADESLRLLMGPGDGCAGHEDAYFSMNTDCAVADKLVLHHLDGSQPDDFDVYVGDGGAWTFIGDYAKQTSTEDWVTTEYTFSPRSGEILFKLVATAPVEGWCADWGQVAFSWAELWGPIQVTIDIKPGSDPNAINLGANGVIPVAILGSAPLTSQTST